MPRLATVDLRGIGILSTVSRGKHLLTRLADGSTLHSHLRMEGHWSVHPRGQRWRRPAHTARLVLTTDGTEAVRRLRADPDVPLGDALLDQRNLGGVGNVYRCELCFLTGTHPSTPVGVVADLPRLVTLVRRDRPGWSRAEHLVVPALPALLRSSMAG